MSHYPEPYDNAGDPNAWNQGWETSPQGPPPMGGDPNAQLAPYNAQTGGYQTPFGPHGELQPSQEQPIAVLGDITVTQNLVMTPVGTFPIRGSMWTLNDMTVVRQQMATWALVVALIGFLFICVFSLFFLLVKETTVSGTIQITVRQGEKFYTTQVPVHSQAQGHQVHQQFQYIRSMAV
ncbi:hypothetical protein [Actinorugispora endophytica]|uniref:Uncharacterized protein n=1 Tax=Actinorugispora endophytica TaxID=1605990 RepID=A0A4R6UYN1_9ACTN|nr:hypothetical protein [Actinorugispora endophytica]TDQ48784.1 hypothetical protein EV190_11739 [Actinorugispora endophytica]